MGTSVGKTFRSCSDKEGGGAERVKLGGNPEGGLVLQTPPIWIKSKTLTFPKSIRPFWCYVTLPG